jgi:hypothetical protein
MPTVGPTEAKDDKTEEPQAEKMIKKVRNLEPSNRGKTA